MSDATPTPEPPRPKRRLRSIALHALAGVGILGVFVASVVGGVLLHLDSSITRRVVQKEVNKGLGSLFKGKIIVGPIDSIHVEHVRIGSATILDPEGDETIYAEGLDVRFSTIHLLKSLFVETRKGDPLWIAIPDVHIRDARVTLTPDHGTAVPTIAETFAIRDPGKPPPGPPSKEPGREVILTIPKIRIEHCEVRGYVGRPLEGSLEEVHGNVSLSDGLLVVDAEPESIDVTEFLPAETKGSANYHLRIDTNEERVARTLETDDDGVTRPKAPLDMWGGFDGLIGSLPAEVEGELAGNVLKARAKAPRIARDTLADFVPNLPVDGVASARLEAEGTLPEIAVHAKVLLEQRKGAGALWLDGRALLGSELKLELGFRGDEVDPKALVSSLPGAEVGFRGRIRGQIEPSGLLASAEVTTNATSLDGNVIPPVDVAVDYVHGGLIVSANAYETGAATEVEAHLASTGKITFGAEAESFDLQRIVRLNGLLRGAAKTTIRGAFEGGSLSADATVSGGGIGAAGFSANQTVVTAHVEGPVANLRIDSHARLEGVKLGERVVDHVDLHASGSVLQPAVSLAINDSDLGDIVSEGQVDVGARTISNLAFDVDRAGAKASGRVASLVIGDRGVEAKGIAISGDQLGKAAGSLRFEDGELLGDFKAEAIQLQTLGHLAGVPLLSGGLANVDISLQRSAHGRVGHVEVELEDGGLWLLHGISARLSAKLDGDVVESAGFVRLIEHATDQERLDAKKKGHLAEVGLCDGPIAELTLSGRTTNLTGSILSSATWEKALGHGQVAAENLNLKCLKALVPIGLPISDAGGLLTARVDFDRKQGDTYPSIEKAYLRTTGLNVVGPKEFVVFGNAPDPWESHGLDLDVKASTDSHGKVTTTTLLLDTVDGNELAEIKAGITLDWGRLISGTTAAAAWKDPSRFVDARLEQIEEAPISLEVVLPRQSSRDLKALPSFIAQALPPLGGELAVNASAEGTIARPKFKAKVQAFHLHSLSTALSAWTPVVDVDVDASYDSDKGKAKLEGTIAHTDKENGATKTLAQIKADGSLVWDDLIKPTKAPLAWNAGLDVNLTELPIASFPGLQQVGAQGSISGKIAVKGIHKNPKVDVDLKIASMQLGSEKFKGKIEAHITPDGSVSGTVANASAVAKVHFEGGGGSFDVDAKTGLRWKDLVIPKLNRRSAGSVEVNAKKFHMGAFYPFVSSVVSKLDGRLDGKANIGWGTGGSVSEGVSGKLQITDGVVFIPIIGQELKKVKATVISNPDGALRIEGLEASGIRGRLHGDGLISYNASILREDPRSIDADDGDPSVPNPKPAEKKPVVDKKTADTTSPEDEAGIFNVATAKVQIDEGQEIPITFEGVPLGIASGEFLFKAERKHGAIEMDLHAPIIRVEIPNSSSRNVQPLDDEKSIHVSQLLGEPPEKIAAKSTPINVCISLDKVQVRGNDIEAGLHTSRCKADIDAKATNNPAKGDDGGIRIALAEELTIEGDILLDYGSIVLRQKKFELDPRAGVDHGLVRLRREDAGNPYIAATAHWEGPDGGRVFVSYNGVLKPITDEKLTFRSDPARSKQDIITTVLFGTDLTSTASSGGPAETNSSGATQLAGDFGGTLASSALNSLIRSKYVTLTLDTTSDGSIRGKVEWKAAEGLTLGVSGEQVQAQSGGVTTTQNMGLTTVTGQNQQSGAQGELSLDWKFRRNWSLRSTFGAGARAPTTGVDVLWQYSY